MYSGRCEEETIFFSGVVIGKLLRLLKATPHTWSYKQFSLYLLVYLKREHGSRTIWEEKQEQLDWKEQKKTMGYTWNKYLHYMKVL